jgi:hypothetical protein
MGLSLVNSMGLDLLETNYQANIACPSKVCRILNLPVAKVSFLGSVAFLKTQCMFVKACRRATMDCYLHLCLNRPQKKPFISSSVHDMETKED